MESLLLKRSIIPSASVIINHNLISKKQSIFINKSLLLPFLVKSLGGGSVNLGTKKMVLLCASPCNDAFTRQHEDFESSGPVVFLVTHPGPSPLPIEQDTRHVSCLSRRLFDGIQQFGGRVIPFLYGEHPATFFIKLGFLKGIVLRGKTTTTDSGYNSKVKVVYKKFFIGNNVDFLPFLCIGSVCADVLGDVEDGAAQKFLYSINFVNEEGVVELH